MVSLLICCIFISSRNWHLSDSISELEERLAADGAIIEECDIPKGIISKVPFPAFYMKHNRLPVPLLRHFRSDYLKDLKVYSPTQHRCSPFHRQTCKYELKCNLISRSSKMEFCLVFAFGFSFVNSRSSSIICITEFSFGNITSTFNTETAVENL